MTPVSHVFHNPRCERRGGVGLFLSCSIKKSTKCKAQKYTSFEILQDQCEVSGTKVVVVVCKPPSSSVVSFIDEFVLFLDTIDMVSEMVIVCGDFNLWFDDLDTQYV